MCPQRSDCKAWHRPKVYRTGKATIHILQLLVITVHIQGQKSRIAALYLPLLAIALENVSRIDAGSLPVVSPMLGSASIYPERSNSTSTVASPVVVPTAANEQLFNSLSEKDKHESVKTRSSILSVFPSASLHKLAELPPDGPRSPDSLNTSVITQIFNADWSKLYREESRNLLICVLFVLKHLDKGKFLIIIIIIIVFLLCPM